MATQKILTQSEREERQAERNAKLQRARSLLEEGLAKLQTSDDWRAMLERTAKSLRTKLGAGRFSFRNQLLLWMQLGTDDIGPVATFETWKRVGRHVKKGEKALFILQPRPIRPRDKATGKTVRADDDASGDVILTFRPLALFTLQATEGSPLEEPPKLTGDITAAEPFERAIETLREVILALDGEPVSSVDIRPREVGDQPKAFGWYMRTTKAIVVIDTGSRLIWQFGHRRGAGARVPSQHPQRLRRRVRPLGQFGVAASVVQHGRKPCTLRRARERRDLGSWRLVWQRA